MLNTLRLICRTARLSKRGGFTLVELLVVIAIIAILAGVALGPITSGIKKAQQSGAVQGSRALALAEFQYAGDNSNLYPYGSTLGAFVATMVPTYISDNQMLLINGSNQTKYTGTTSSGYTASATAGTVSYDFTYNNPSAGAGGLTTSAPDNTPAVFSGATAALTLGNATTATATETTLIVDSTCPLGIAGLAVTYKGNSSKFITATTGTVNIVDVGYGPYGPVASFGVW